MRTHLERLIDLLLRGYAEMWGAVLLILLCIPQANARGSIVNAVCSTSGYCYSLWQLNPPLSKWEANRHCQRHNHTLATMPNTGDQQTLARQLGSNSAWVGLNMVPTDSWKWLGADGWYENTIPSEDITYDDNQACLIMNRRSIFGGSCGHALEYLCEFKTKPPASTGCHLEPASVGNKYVCLRKDELNWMSAARFCLSQQGNLLIINNAAELNQMKQTLLDWGTGSHFYIGGTRVILSWEEPGVRSNPYALKWSANVSSNPNLDEAIIKNGDSLCIYLSSFMKGLVHMKCTRKLPRVICSLRNQTAGGAVSPAGKPVTVIYYESTKIMVSEEKYMAAVVCAFSIPILLMTIAIIIGMFIWRKKRHTSFSPESYSSSVASFPPNQMGSTASVHTTPEPLPTPACDPNINDQELPPPPPEFRVDSIENSPPLPTEYLQLSDNPADLPETPPLPSRANKSFLGRYKKKKAAPDPTYAQIDKTTKRPPPPPISP